MNARKLLVGNPEGKRPLEDKDVGRWMDNIEMDLR
jgi:hypothetical protein